MSYFNTVQIYDGSSGPAKIDASTHGMLAISHIEESIHEGSHYFVEGYDTIGSAATIDFTIVTPDTTTWAEMRFQITGSLKFTIQVYEGTDADADGTLATPINSNRNSNNTSVLVVRRDPTINTVGDLIGGQSYGDNKKYGGTAEKDDFMILEQGQTYLYRITSNAASNVLSFAGRWMEHVSEE